MSGFQGKCLCFNSADISDYPHRWYSYKDCRLQNQKPVFFFLIFQKFYDFVLCATSFFHSYYDLVSTAIFNFLAELLLAFFCLHPFCIYLPCCVCFDYPSQFLFLFSSFHWGLVMNIRQWTGSSVFISITITNPDLPFQNFHQCA